MTKMFPRYFLASAGLACTMMAAGCGNKPKLVPVTGKVSHKGQPVTAGSVILVPDPGNSYLKDSPSSLLQTDGSFTFKTFPFGEGVPPGRYTGTLAPELAKRLRVPSHGKAETSPWKLDVTEKGLKDIVWEVK